MYYNKFIQFLKEHNLYDDKLFKYWFDNTIRFDYKDDEARDFIGVYYDIKDGYLRGMRSVLPFIDNDITILINIHEYIHMLLMYKKLNKKCIIGNDVEVLPILFERIYVRENETEELVKYLNYLDDYIISSNDYKYVLALEMSSKLLEYYRGQDIYKLNNKVKRMVLRNDIKKAFNI